MSTVTVKRHRSSKEDRLEEIFKKLLNRLPPCEEAKSFQDEVEPVFERLLSCLPPYEEVKFFLDLVRRRCSFTEEYNKERRLVILGTSIPEELIYASGATPYWILGGSRTLSVLADDSVPRDTDPVSRAMLGCLQSDIGDFMKDALILIPLISDSSRKLAYILKAKGYQVHTIYIPPTQGRESDYELSRQGDACADIIYKYTGKPITKQALLKAQEKIGEARKQIQYFMQMTHKKSELIPGIWKMFILYSYYCTNNLEEWSHHLRALNNQLATGSTQNNTGATSSILLLGSPVYFPNYKVPFLIHDVKLDIAVQLDYTTEKFLHSYQTDKMISIERLMCSFYKNDCSSAYAENRSLFESVSKILEQKLIDGVIYHILKGQTEYDFELEHLEELFSTYSIPVCRLETDYNYQDIEQLRIRLDAFQEVLTQKQFRKEVSTI